MLPTTSTSDVLTSDPDSLTDGLKPESKLQAIRGSRVLLRVLQGVTQRLPAGFLQGPFIQSPTGLGLRVYGGSGLGRRA